MARRTRTQVCTNHNTPRSIRTRLSHPRRHSTQPELPAPEVPLQPVARSSSGRTALGPWLGSFGSLENMSGLVDEAPPSPTLFATSQGRVFANLSGARVASADLLLASAQVMASAEPQVVPEDSRGGRLAQAQEAGVLRRKSEARLPPGAPALRGPRGGAARRRMREIGQARKMN